MKNYKYLIPVALVVCMILGVYSLVSSAVSQKKEYDENLTAARKYSEQEIVEDAVLCYQNALDIQDSVEVSIELGQMYADQGLTSEAITWGEYLVDHFPKDGKVYAFLLKLYADNEQYEECFALRDEAESRGVVNKEFQNQMEKIAYVCELGYDYYDNVSVWGNGMCAVCSDDEWGFVDETGDNVISEQFAWVGAFTTDEIAPVRDMAGEFYFISSSGNKKLAVQNIRTCEALGISVDQIIAVKDGTSYAYYDSNFEKLSGDYEFASAMNGGIAVVQQNGSWKIINNSYDETCSRTFDAFIIDEKGITYRNDRLFAQDEDRYYLVNKSGETVGEQTYENAKLFQEQDGLAAVCVDGKWGFIDSDGKMQIAPQYEDARSFSNGFAAIQSDGQWGFINTDGEIAIQPQFEDAKDFSASGSAFVMINGQWRVLRLISKNYQ